MRFRTDDRAVTVQIGTVLLFAVLIVLVSLYQASVVPQQNGEVEFNHNQQVQSELQDLRNELRRTAVTGTGGSATVTLGTRYPVRAFFVNPTPPSGTLRTTEAANFVVDNAVADGEVFDYWNGSARSFSTAGVVYDPEYSEYQRPPTTVYRNGLLYNRFADANLTLGGQRLVQGDRISLVAVDGSLSEAGSGAESVDVQPVSTATRTVTVSNESASEPVTLVVPTSLSGASAVELWSESLADQSRVETVEPATLAGGQSAVRIVLEPGSYELELAKVGVGTGVTGVGPHYVTIARGDNASVSTGGNQRVVVEVRDRFNNPVSGATVNVSDLASPVTPTQAETDSDGRATFVYEAPDEAGTERVEFNISRSPLPRERATADLFVDGGSGGGGGNDTYAVNWTDASGAGLDCDAGFTDCTLNANAGTSVDLTANVTADDAPVSQATVDYAVNDSGLGSVTPAEGITGNDGEAATRLDVAEANGTVDVYAASGDAVDPVTVTVVDPPEGSRPTLNWSVTDNTDVSGNEPSYSVSYDVSNAWPSYDGVEVEFENLDDGGLSDTVSGDGTRGTVEYSAGYGQGTTYNITIRALAANGSVLGERSLVDVADSNDPDGDDDLGSPSGPELAGRWITDASDDTDGAVYDASYNVTNRDEFGHVEVEFRNLDDDSATRTVTSNDSRGRASYAPSYGNGGNYEILFRVYDADGVKVDDRTVTDSADGNEPSGNELLANATSPTLTNVDVTDVSEPWNSDFEVDYAVDDPAGTFGSVEVEYKNVDTGETVETDVETSPSGTVQLDTYEPNGDEFDITVRVYDESNAIVDAETVTEVGNGTNDGGGGGGGGGGGPSDQTVRPVDSEGVTSGTQLTFTVENAGSESVTVTDFAVDASGVDADRLNNGDSDELSILRASQPGYANADGPGNSPDARYEADGTSYALADEGAEAVLEPGDDDVTVDFRGFDADLGTLQFVDSAADADVVVTLTLDDGSEQAFYFEQQ